MSFFYTREPGPEGQILAAEGPPGGRPLVDLLRAGPLPVKAALELVAYCADIVTISQEDGVVHGDIRPANVRVDESGAVTIAGWGEPWRTGPAPEARPVGAPTDVYGLAVVLHGVLASVPLGDVPRERDDHDDYIVDRLMQIDWQELSDKRWMDEVLHFLCSMLAFDPLERPVALDVANVLGQVAAQATGMNITTWAGGGRPAAAPGPVFMDDEDEDEDDEDLGGPESLGTPVSATSALKLRKAASAKGEATAFWSRERIKELLHEEDEPVRARFDVGPARRTAPDPSHDLPPTPDATISGVPSPIQPKPVQLAPSAPPARAQFLGTAADAPEPPPFLTASGPPPAPVAPAPPPSPFQTGTFDDPTRLRPEAAPAPRPAAAPAPAQPAWTPPRPGATPPAIVANPGVSDSPPPAAAPAKGMGLKLVVGLLLAIILGCGGLSVAGGLFWWFQQRSASFGTEPADVAPPADPPPPPAAPPRDTGSPPGDRPPKASGAQPSSAKASGSGSKGSGSTGSGSKSSSSNPSSSKSGSSGASSGSSSSSKSGSSGASSGSSSPSKSGSSGASSGSSSGSSSSSKSGSSGSSTSSGSTPAPAPGGFPAKVRISHAGPETTLECSPGGRRTFTGSTTLDIDTVTTCRVRTEDMMTAIQLRSGGEVTCSSSSGQLVCTGP